jgi:uncharacterized repeat protein (TIGR03803 family)
MNISSKFVCGLLFLAMVASSLLKAQTVNILYNFSASNNDGIYPGYCLLQGNDGNFYGTTNAGGSNQYSSIFKITPAGNLTNLVTFTGVVGINTIGLMQGADGNFYGTTEIGGSHNDGTVFMMTPAGVLTTLVSFTGANGANPSPFLTQGTDGNFYGTTLAGLGTVFKVTPMGALTTLVAFTSTSGDYPFAGLTQDSDGNFYGENNYGGSANDGTIFKITPAGVLTTLVTFTGANGRNPSDGLVQGSDGNFYGTTNGNGESDGTIFKMTPSGVLTTLVSFNGTDGAEPAARMVQGRDGNFYGSTYYYGGGSIGYGSVFEMTPTGVLTTLVAFDNTDGAQPRASLVQGGDGNFYGMTYEGGSSNDGVFFQLIPPQPVPVLPRWGWVTLATSLYIVCAVFLKRGKKLRRGVEPYD